MNLKVFKYSYLGELHVEFNFNIPSLEPKITSQTQLIQFVFLQLKCCPNLGLRQAKTKKIQSKFLAFNKKRCR